MGKHFSSAEIRQHAEEVEAMPHVQKWIRQFNALADKMPKEIWMYIVASSPTAIARGPNGEFFDRPDGIDGTPHEAIVHGIVRKGHWDGGDW